MPLGKFSKIREVSSEDSIHSSQNLLKPEASQKWKTKSPGEKDAHVIIEFDEAQQIQGIDIGNEHSAFIEVLVGKDTATSDNFQQILMTCSFMTPIESKNSNNSNRVRCFNREALCSSVLGESWSQLKVVCSQPFNKHVQYGISFIKVYVAEKKPEVKKNASTLLINRFKMRSESPESDSSSSMLFNRWKTQKTDSNSESSYSSLNSQEAILKKAMARKSESNINHKRDHSQFNESSFNASTATKKTAGTEKTINDIGTRVQIDSSKNIEKGLKTQNKEVKRIDKVVPLAELDKSGGKASRENKRKSSSMDSSTSPISKIPKLNKQRKTKPFNQLLNGVTLVISGIQNPERANLRNMALALGAKYKGDWDSSCTHLICAYKNTPKYNQVKGHGKIVARRWVETCYDSRKYIPWRRFALESNELTKPESDEEILEEQTEANNSENETNNRHGKQRRNSASSSGSNDTEDEIRRVVMNSKQNQISKCYDVSTDEEDYLKVKQ